MMKICAFCSSSDAIPEIYNKEAKELAKLIAENKNILINGGAKVGMMEIMSKQVIGTGGRVIGIIPEIIHNKNLASENLSELIVTKDMRSRKEKMSELSDAFIALAGGFGTLEELMEVITLKQLDVHRKPIVILNTTNFYSRLLDQFDVFYDNEFTKSEYKQLYFVANNSREAMKYIMDYEYSQLDSKWYKTNLDLDKS